MVTEAVVHNEKLVALLEQAFSFHEQGMLENAEKLYLQLSSDFPGLWHVHFNLGLLYFEQNQLSRALYQYTEALRLNDQSNDLYYNLALCQKESGLMEEAISNYCRALKLVPDDIDCLYNLAGCYTQIEKFIDALACYQKVLDLQPDHRSALSNTAFLYHKTGEGEKAIKFYSLLLEIDPEDNSARHMLSSLKGEHRNTAPHSYIKEVFDSYSDHYEDSLINKLEYALPGRLLELIGKASDRKEFHSVIDLGCGTGLCGEVLAPYCYKLHGIDLSESMVAIAETKQIYHELLIGDIETLIETRRSEQYDLILAADVFAYLGQLDSLFRDIGRLIKKDGLFCFSAENLPSETVEFKLMKSGRFAHSNSYVKRLARDYGWSVLSSDLLDLRKESDRWIQGAFYCLEPVLLHE